MWLAKFKFILKILLNLSEELSHHLVSWVVKHKSSDVVVVLLFDGLANPDKVELPWGRRGTFNFAKSAADRSACNLQQKHRNHEAFCSKSKGEHTFTYCLKPLSLSTLVIVFITFLFTIFNHFYCYVSSLIELSLVRFSKAA